MSLPIPRRDGLPLMPLTTGPLPRPSFLPVTCPALQFPPVAPSARVPPFDPRRSALGPPTPSPCSPSAPLGPEIAIRAPLSPEAVGPVLASLYRSLRPPGPTEGSVARATRELDPRAKELTGQSYAWRSGALPLAWTSPRECPPPPLECASPPLSPSVEPCDLVTCRPRRPPRLWSCLVGPSPAGPDRAWTPSVRPDLHSPRPWPRP